MSDSYYVQEPDYSHTPSLPLISHSDARNQLPPRKPYLDSPLVTGIDRGLRLLLLNGLITVFWGIALIVFQTGIVPVSGELPDNHPGVMNVIVTGIATISTSHLHFTIQNTVREYLDLLLHQGFTLRQWAWMQEFARGSIWPPFTLKRHPVVWSLWLLVYGLMAAHSASLVAILQPQSRWGHVMIDDYVPCGIDANTSTLNPNLTVLTGMNVVAEQIGIQLGSYYYQITSNTTTATPYGDFVKDKFGYGASLYFNTLEEVPGVEIVAECTNSSEVNKLAVLWSAAFPGQVLPAPIITNGSGTFGALPESTSQQAVITSAPTFNLTGTQTALYAIVNASGGGGLLTVDATGDMMGCTWTAVPRLVHLRNLDGIFATIGADNATTLPLPTGNAVCSAVQGMAQAVRLGGASLDYQDPLLDGDSSITVKPQSSADVTAMMLEVLLADALKGALTLYTTYAQLEDFDPTLTGANPCQSNTRYQVLLWHFGNEHNLGWIGIALSMGFGGFALYAVWHLRTRTRIKGLDALKVVDAFKLGVDTGDVEAEDGDRVLYVRNGMVLPIPKAH